MVNTLRLWDKTSNLKNQLNETITPDEARSRYGIAASADKVLLEENPQGQLIAIDDFAVIRSICDVDPELSDAEAIESIIYAKDNPPQPEPYSSPEELLNILLGEEVE